MGRGVSNSKGYPSLRAVHPKKLLLALLARCSTDAASVRRSDFKKIEFMLRQGHKRLRLLSMPGTMAVASTAGPAAARRFSTSAAPASSRSQWDAPERPRAHVVSLGCGRNWVDSEVMLGDFLRAGFEIEPLDPERAALLVVISWRCFFLLEMPPRVRGW